MNELALLLVAGAIAATGLFVLFAGTWRAPTGYQDESGFHFGLPETLHDFQDADDGEYSDFSDS